MGESLVITKVNMKIPIVGRNAPIRAVNCHEHKIPMIYANGIPEVAAIDAEFIIQPLNLVVLISGMNNEKMIIPF